MIDCSVIVLAWQESAMTRKCVESLGRNAQVIVVDNGSDPEYSLELRRLSEEDANRVYVRCETNLGYAGGMNAGLVHAARSVVIFSNNDVIANEQTLRRLTDRCLEPGVGAAFPYIKDERGEEHVPAGRFLTLGRAAAHALGLSYLLRPLFGLEAEADKGEWYSGPFVAMRRLTAISLGGIPQHSFFYSEDYRLCWELKNRGYGLALVKGATIHHIDDASATRVWSPEGISQRQTSELIRAAVDHQTNPVGKQLLPLLFLFGAWWRNKLRPSAERQAIYNGSMEALRNRKNVAVR